LNKLRISVVQYLNTAPLVRGFTHGPLQGNTIFHHRSSQCAEELRTGAATSPSFLPSNTNASRTW